MAAPARMIRATNRVSCTLWRNKLGSAGQRQGMDMLANSAASSWFSEFLTRKQKKGLQEKRNRVTSDSNQIFQEYAEGRSIINHLTHQLELVKTKQKKKLARGDCSFIHTPTNQNPHRRRVLVTSLHCTNLISS